MTNDSKRRTGMTLIEMVIVILVLTILLAIAIPACLTPRESSRSRLCQTNLWHIQAAKEQWAIENRKSYAQTPTKDDLAPDYLKQFPSCPINGTYNIQQVNTNPTCSVGGDHVLN